MKRRDFVKIGAGTSLFLAGCLGTVTGGGYAKIDKDLSDVKVQNPSMGSGIKVEAYVDYACPHCKKFHENEYPKLEEMAKNGDIKYVHHDFPVPVRNPASYKAAVASRSVYNQADSETYWEYNSYLFEKQGNYRNMARKAGLSEEKAEQVVEDVEDKTYLDVVLADKKRGEERGVKGTPTIFVDGEKIENWDETVSKIESKK